MDLTRALLTPDGALGGEATWPQSANQNISTMIHCRGITQQAESGAFIWLMPKQIARGRHLGKKGTMGCVDDGEISSPCRD